MTSKTAPPTQLEKLPRMVNHMLLVAPEGTEYLTACAPGANRSGPALIGHVITCDERIAFENGSLIDTPGVVVLYDGARGMPIRVEDRDLVIVPVDAVLAVVNDGMK